MRKLKQLFYQFFYRKTANEKYTFMQAMFRIAGQGAKILLLLDNQHH
jgi:hypothetical protein